MAVFFISFAVRQCSASWQGTGPLPSMSAEFCSAVFISSGPEREMFNDDLDAGHEEDNKGDESNSTASNKEEIEEPQYGTQQVPDLLPGLHIVKEEQWCDQARHKEHIEEIWQLTSFRRTPSVTLVSPGVGAG
jgi:hypothetical protein